MKPTARSRFFGARFFDKRFMAALSVVTLLVAVAVPASGSESVPGAGDNSLGGGYIIG